MSGQGSDLRRCGPSDGSSHAAAAILGRKGSYVPWIFRGLSCSEVGRDYRFTPERVSTARQLTVETFATSILRERAHRTRPPDPAPRPPDPPAERRHSTRCEVYRASRRRIATR